MTKAISRDTVRPWYAPIKPWVLPPAHRLILWAAHRRRVRLAPRHAIGITGSWGKTTTKCLLADILRARGRLLVNDGSLNGVNNLARKLLRAPAATRYLLQECASSGPGSMQPMLDLLRPDVAVITVIRRDHFKNFRTIEAVAHEKAGLVRAVPPHGLVVLNRDDELAWAMREQTRARVVSYGLHPEADVRAEDVRADWPDALSFTLVCAAGRYPVHTALYGHFWVQAALAALATAIALGVPPEDAGAALRETRTIPGRMNVSLLNGVHWVEDVWKNPFDGIAEVLEFVRAARAPRKFLVLGTLSDYGGAASPKYRRIARQALPLVDGLILCSLHSDSAAQVDSDAVGTRAFACGRWEDVGARLYGLLRPGDLVVVRATCADHLERVRLNLEAPVRCHRQHCGLLMHCGGCRLLRRG